MQTITLNMSVFQRIYHFAMLRGPWHPYKLASFIIWSKIYLLSQLTADEWVREEALERVCELNGLVHTISRIGFSCVFSHLSLCVCSFFSPSCVLRYRKRINQQTNERLHIEKKKIDKWRSSNLYAFPSYLLSAWLARHKEMPMLVQITVHFAEIQTLNAKQCVLSEWREREEKEEGMNESQFKIGEISRRDPFFNRAPLPTK